MCSRTRPDALEKTGVAFGESNTIPLTPNPQNVTTDYAIRTPYRTNILTSNVLRWKCKFMLRRFNITNPL